MFDDLTDDQLIALEAASREAANQADSNEEYEKFYEKYEQAYDELGRRGYRYDAFARCWKEN